MSITKLARVLGAGAIALAAAASSASAQDKVIYQLDWLPGGDKAPIYVCINRGFCKKAGLDVSITSGRGSTEAITKLGTGSSDIGSAGMEALMAAKARENVPVIAVMSIFNQGPHAFFTLKGNGVTEMKDVKGKRIATSPFTASNVFLPLILADMGMSESDIRLTKADPGALGPMLMTGSTDVIIAWMTDVSRYTNQAIAAKREIVVMPWSTQGLNLYSAALVASEKFLKERPDVARRFVAAFKQSMEYVKTNPAESVAAVTAIVPELTGPDVNGQLKDMLVLMHNDVSAKDGLGALEAKRLAETWARTAASLKLDPKSLDPEKVVNRSFMPK
ncbi:MAG: ABC transporter substrate-binding protein [Beijerinckiaceae bacterium]|nr:ABC transporter substrate-binding protein [Beijerinckiaceae bacterium]